MQTKCIDKPRNPGMRPTKQFGFRKQNQRNWSGWNHHPSSLRWRDCALVTNPTSSGASWTWWADKGRNTSCAKPNYGTWLMIGDHWLSICHEVETHLIDPRLNPFAKLPEGQSVASVESEPARSSQVSSEQSLGPPRPTRLLVVKKEDKETPAASGKHDVFHGIQSR